MTIRNTGSRFPRWAMWLMTIITALAASILILAIVLGIQSGQRQVELQRQQQIGIALQQAIEYRTEGKFSESLEHYRVVLGLDPQNELATEGVQTMLAAVEQNAPSVAATTLASDTQASLAAVNNAEITSTQSVATDNADLNTIWQEATSALQAGLPQNTIDKLLQLRQLNPAFRSDELPTMLFNAYLQLARQQDSEDLLQESLTSLENALAIRPSATTVQLERDLLSDYLDMESFYDVNWTGAIELLRSIRQRDANYRDVNRRLVEATIAYGDQLMAVQPCDAIAQYEEAVKLVGATPLLAEKQTKAQLDCTTFETAVALSGTVTTTVNALGTPILGNESATSVSGGALPASGLRGRILYAARDVNDGRFRIFAQSAASTATPPTLVVEDASQPALRNDGQRLAYHNLRSDLGGVSTFDPGSGLSIRITSFAEDGMPSWNFNGGRIAFASTRESDRRWRLYLVWAQQDGETTLAGFGEAPAWHPTDDLLAYRGCDQTGNNCGIWQMDGSSANQIPLTNVQNDNRPAWSPDGKTVVFMSDGRTGNFDIFRLDTTTRQVTQLTDSPNFDMLPTVSPDGQSVAFVSNRDGSWKIYVVPITGGAARVLAPLRGDFGDWQNQKLDWVN